MTDATSALAAVLDRDHRFVDANAELVSLLGPRPDAVVGSSWSSFLAPELRGDDLSPTGPVDWHGRRADGLPWCATLSFWSPAGLDGGSVVAGVRRFGPVGWVDQPEPTGPPRPPGIDTVVSHDLRGALRGGSGFVTVVKRALDDPSIARLHDRLAKAGEHLAIAARSVATADETAEKVVQYLRWGQRPFAIERVALDRLVRDAAAQADATETTPPVEVTVGSLPEVLADVEHVRWAITELITNAAKFNDGSASVTFTRDPASTDDGYCVVRVHDNGIGIDPQLAGDAFLFGRKLQARGDYGGVGMGLPLCELVFQRHAGWCRVAPDTGADGGSTILFCLPSTSGPDLPIDPPKD